MGSKSVSKEDFGVFSLLSFTVHRSPFTAFMGRWGFLLRSSVVVISFVLITGCASSAIQPAQVAPPPPPLFPPQTIMYTGDYAGFYTENLEALKTCQDPGKCSLALFNLSFLCCYSKSPYYDPRLGLKYIDDLIAAAPGSPWAGQAMVWKDLIEKSMKKKIRKRSTTREDTKAKEGEEPPAWPEDSARPDEVVQGKDFEADRQRMEDEIASKDEIIKKLRGQLERSRQIDIEMEKKERGLLP
jgi:hypothetical protein